MSKQAFEKYGVSEDVDLVQDVKTAQFDFNKIYHCPWCGKQLVMNDFVNVLMCPEHGTLPFESTQ